MKPNKKGEKKYRCTKCGKVFNIGHEVTVEGALCNECFDQLLKLNTAKDYFFYKKVIMKPNKIKEKFRKWFWRDAIHAREDFYTHEGKGNWVAVAQGFEDYLEKSLDQQKKEIKEKIENWQLYGDSKYIKGKDGNLYLKENDLYDLLNEL